MQKVLFCYFILQFTTCFVFRFIMNFKRFMCKNKLEIGRKTEKQNEKRRNCKKQQRETLVAVE